MRIDANLRRCVSEGCCVLDFVFLNVVNKLMGIAFWASVGSWYTMPK